MKNRGLIKIHLLFIFISFSIFPQQSKLSKAVNELSSFIASDYFTELKKTNSELALVDTIYLRAVNFYNNDYGEALLALTFITIPYREVPIKLPLLNSTLYYPLISADEKTFRKKTEQSPRYLFYDTPNTSYGDLDKPAHFFGNAYIGYSENIFDLSNLIGYFVESFEEDFKAQSKVDYRDIDVNFYGDLFGKILSSNKHTLPSQVMLIRSLIKFSYSL